MAETKLTSEEINQISAQNLAYLGDCVYELYVREHLVRKNSSRASVESLKYVTAHIQSGVVEKILPLLTEEEEDAFRHGFRGRKRINKYRTDGDPASSVLLFKF